MIAPETTSTGRWVEGFIFRLANLPSDPCGASLCGYTFTPIPRARRDRAGDDRDWEGGGKGFIFRLANIPSDPCGASLGG